MHKDLVIRWVRRAGVLALTGAVLAVGVVTVQAAADWRAAEAPLDVKPVSMSSISDDAAAESDRTAALSAQIDDVASQLAQLKGAVLTVNGSVTGDTDSATALSGQLDEAKARLTTVQQQLKAAQARLVALNKAAARQAAINRSAGARRPAANASPAKPAGNGGGERDD